MKVCLLFLLVLVASCTTRDPDYFTLRTINSDGKIRNINTEEHNIEKISDPSKLKKFKLDPRLSELWQYGLLSSTFADEGEEAPVKLDNLCEGIEIKSSWQKNVKFSYDEFTPIRQKEIGYKIEGLDYSVWQDTSAHNPKKVAIVFRGTDFDEFGDWYSNLRGITRINPFTWDQYQQTRDLIPALVRKLKSIYGRNVEIITAGHSLGGGLAQHAAFSSKEIKLAYAFASSPITGSTSLDNRISSENVDIISPYEAGEAASLLRWVRRNLVFLPKKSPNITEVRFNFRSTFNRGRKGGGIIEQHFIRRFACDLVCRLRDGSTSVECGTGE